jgi:pimeloyl-ACP methyl ester carboxylesterase
MKIGKVRRSRLARYLGITAVAAIAMIGLALSVRAILSVRIRKADVILSPPGIEWSGSVNINGVPQWLAIRGDDARNPLLLYLHGGPGSPATLLAGHRYSAGIERHFVVVHWEQRGTCKSYSPALEKTPLTTAQLIADADAVAHYLLVRFHREKLYLVGHSWGSLLGINAITDHPDRYYAYIGIGQFVNAIEQERISLHFALDYLKRTGNTAGYAKLAALGEPPYPQPFDAIVRQRIVLMRAGGVSGETYPLARQISDALVCPQYSLMDSWRFFKGSIFSLRSSLNREYWDWKLDATHLRFSVPVYLFIGHHDYNTPYELAERYFDAIQAPRKGKVMFENAAHMIPYEDPERFNREVVRVFGPSAGQ